MKSNITLIGMPGAGKSTIGIILAKIMTWGFVDTDVLIQIKYQKSPQRILDESDYLNLRAIESREILKINVENHVIATGGSAVYSHEAMRHLLDISTVVFLKVDYEILKKRIHSFSERGISKADGQSFKALFDERRPLYEKYARMIIEGGDLSQDETAMRIVSVFNEKDFRP